MIFEEEDLTEETIIRRIIDGDVNLFEQILRKYEGYVLTIVKRHVPVNMIEDTAQEAFIRTYQALPDFQNQGGFRHWLSTITVRTCYDLLRKHYRRRECVMEPLSGDYTHWLDTLTSAESEEKFNRIARREEARELLDHVLKNLSAEERIVLELVHLEGYSCREAAEMLDWSTANVKVRAYRSRRKLRRLLTKLLH